MAHVTFNEKVVLCDHDLHFQGQIAIIRAVSAELRRLVRRRRRVALVHLVNEFLLAVLRI